jgi:hypothetical protein
LNISLDSCDLKPLVREIVGQVLAELASVQATGERLAYREAEAAALIGVNGHVLRDARLRKEITATKVGGRFAYEKTELIAYLARQRV